MTPSRHTRREAIELCSIAACEHVSLAAAAQYMWGRSILNHHANVWRLALRARLAAYDLYRQDMEMGDVAYFDTVLEAERMLREGWRP